MTRAAVALLLAVAGAACGVKAPPRAPGGNDKAPPNDLFKPARDTGPVAPEPITVGPQAPAAPPAGADSPAAPPPPAQEPNR
jgi:hypothetical protein